MGKWVPMSQGRRLSLAAVACAAVVNTGASLEHNKTGIDDGDTVMPEIVMETTAGSATALDSDYALWYAYGYGYGSAYYRHCDAAYCHPGCPWSKPFGDPCCIGCPESRAEVKGDAMQEHKLGDVDPAVMIEAAMKTLPRVLQSYSYAYGTTTTTDQPSWPDPDWQPSPLFRPFYEDMQGMLTNVVTKAGPHLTPLVLKLFDDVFEHNGFNWNYESPSDVNVRQKWEIRPTEIELPVRANIGGISISSIAVDEFSSGTVTRLRAKLWGYLPLIVIFMIIVSFFMTLVCGLCILNHIRWYRYGSGIPNMAGSRKTQENNRHKSKMSAVYLQKVTTE